LLTAFEAAKCNLVRVSTGSVICVTESLSVPLSLHAERISSRGVAVGFLGGGAYKVYLQAIFKPFKTICTDRPIVFRMSKRL
jgi:hypothetical protein